MSDEKLLKEYIEAILAEDAGDGYGAGGGYDYGFNDGMYGGGGGYGSGGGDALTRMMKDVGKIAVGGMKGAAEEFSVRVWTALKVAKEAILVTLIPGLEDDFDKIFAREKELLNQVKTRYAEVFKMVDQYAFHDDFVFLAFMWSPSTVVSSVLAKKAPGAAIELLKVFATGNDKLYNLLSKMKYIVDNNSPNTHADPTKKHSGLGRTVAAAGSGAAIVAVKERLKKLAEDGKIQDIIDSNSLSDNLKSESEVVTKGVLQKLYDTCQKEIAKVSTVEDIKNNYPHANLDNLGKAANSEQRNQLEQKIVGDVKLVIKGRFERQIQARIRRAERLGFPADGKFIELHETALEKIRSL